jgi:Protein of unknown function (DUF669)
MTQLGFFVSPEDAVERTFDDSVSTPVPAGWYDAEIKKADVLPTKNGGHRINIRYDITGPTHSGRVVFGSINIAHATNPQVAEIGRQQLALVAAALNKRISDTDELLGGALRIKVKVTKSEQYGESNDVVTWGRASSALPQASLGSAAPKSGNTPPWVK